MISSIKDCTLLNNGVEMPWLGFGVFKMSDGQKLVTKKAAGLVGEEIQDVPARSLVTFHIEK